MGNVRAVSRHSHKQPSLPSQTPARPTEIGVHAVERALLPNTRHRSSGLKIEGEHFREQTGEQSSSPKTLGAAPRRCPHPPPENLIPMLDTETRRDSVHRMDPHYFSSPVRASAAGQEEGEARNSLDGKQDFHPVGLWDCDFRWPLPVKSHRFVFKTWCLPTCLLWKPGPRGKRRFS
uniref:Uncharacterized protein n=1 Tax=Myotis myotis TaxID=51298 RepID=A0A7J7VYA2_MYOMY|nr:hypothetical protein mMyoMyo1_012207 [Myotis myotis]